MSDDDPVRDAENAEKVEEAAQLLIERYGDAAMVIASVSADEMIAKRDQPGVAMWMLIRAAVRRRLAHKRGQYQGDA